METGQPDTVIVQLGYEAQHLTGIDMALRRWPPRVAGNPADLDASGVGQAHQRGDIGGEAVAFVADGERRTGDVDIHTVKAELVVGLDELLAPFVAAPGRLAPFVAGDTGVGDVAVRGRTDISNEEKSSERPNSYHRNSDQLLVTIYAWETQPRRRPAAIQE